MLNKSICPEKTKNSSEGRAVVFLSKGEVLKDYILREIAHVGTWLG